jgi:hypothetical protein
MGPGSRQDDTEFAEIEQTTSPRNCPVLHTFKNPVALSL